MKIEQPEKEFQPITIKLETLDEAHAFFAIINDRLKTAEDNGTEIQDIHDLCLKIKSWIQIR